MAIKKEEIFQEITKFYPISNEKCLKLEEFVNLLLKHNQKYNLIGKSTIEDIWSRHILDSAQLMKLIPETNVTIGDFGSGAGLPAIILSILGVKEIHLIEKSYRKCEFLEIAKNISDNKIVVHQKMAEKIDPIKFDVITSRAFAPLERLINITKKFAHKDTIAIFPKGKNITKEIKLVETLKTSCYKIYPSLTSKEGNILLINNFKDL